MVAPTSIPAGLDDGRIVADIDLDRVGNMVAAGEVCVLKHAFASRRDWLQELRRDVFAWSREIAPDPEPDPLRNCHCHQAGISRRQQTPHVFHSYNFNRLDALPLGLRERLTEAFTALAGLHAALTGQSFALEATAGEVTYHPQMIQYPAGGGMFGRHVHALEPQRVGMVTAMSQQSVDFQGGGTGFESPAGRVETAGDHDLGDIVLFRYDLPHWVTPTDAADDFDWSSDRGRWTMVLPAY